MGSNKRYGTDVTDRTLERLQDPGPTSLFREETGDRVTAAREPIAVRAWVRFGHEPAHVDALAVAWTPVAVRVMFEHRTGKWDAWVWASAVERRTAPGDSRSESGGSLAACSPAAHATE